MERENETVMLHGIESMARIAKLEKALATEREECAKVADSYVKNFEDKPTINRNMRITFQSYGIVASRIAEDIRARAALSGGDKEETRG